MLYITFKSVTLSIYSSDVVCFLGIETYLLVLLLELLTIGLLLYKLSLYY